MKKGFGKFLKSLLILVIILGLAYIAYQAYQANKSKQNPASNVKTTSFSKITVKRGEISQKVISTGSISYKNSLDLNAPLDITLKSIEVNVGDAIKAGDVLLSYDQDALKSSIQSLKTDIQAQDTSIINLYRNYQDELTLKSNVSGLVKQIYASQGDLTHKAQSQNNGLILISLDGLMNVTVKNSTNLKIGAIVKVSDATRSYDGTVNRISGDQALITFPDTTTALDEEVKVSLSNQEVENGKAQINMPFLYSSFTDGLITKVYPSLNTKVNKGTALFSVTQVLSSDEYQNALSTKADLQNQLAQAEALFVNPVLIAECDGIIAGIPTDSKASIKKGSTLVSLYTGDEMEMTINIDELDIASLQAGQKSGIVLDALSGIKYEGFVSNISHIGTNTSGITNFSVKIALTNDSKMKIGMNGTATIVVKEEKDSLLIPLIALQTDKNGSFVWLYQEQQGTEQQDNPGKKTYVKTGLSNEDYVSITEGLNENDTLLIFRSSNNSTTSPANSRQNNHDAFLDMGGAPGQMPGGMRPGKTNNQNSSQQNGGGK